MKISVNMIIGDRIEPFLKYALESVKWADEIVIVNTSPLGVHSVNEEVYRQFFIESEIKYTVVDYYGLHEKFDFATARNVAIEHSKGDFILKVDADEVYYNSFEKTVRGLNFKEDIYQVEFYHFMLDVFHYQYIEKKQVLFRRDAVYWLGKTHEILKPVNAEIKASTDCLLQDRFCHFGYAQPQKVIFEKWQQYVEIEGRPDWYKGQDPEHILDDRERVSTKFIYEYPEAIRDDIDNFPNIIETKNRMAKVGIVAGATDNNKEIFNIIDKMKKEADFTIAVVIALSHCTDDFVAKVKASGISTLVYNEMDEIGLINKGIETLLEDPDVRWIGTGKTGKVKDIVKKFDKKGYGLIIGEDIFISPVEVYQKLGLFRDMAIDSAFSDFVKRVQLNNLIVEEL